MKNQIFLVKSGRLLVFNGKEYFLAEPTGQLVRLMPKKEWQSLASDCPEISVSLKGKQIDFPKEFPLWNFLWQTEIIGSNITLNQDDDGFEPNHLSRRYYARYMNNELQIVSYTQDINHPENEGVVINVTGTDDNIQFRSKKFEEMEEVPFDAIAGVGLCIQKVIEDTTYDYRDWEPDSMLEAGSRFIGKYKGLTEDQRWEKLNKIVDGRLKKGFFETKMFFDSAL